MLLRPLMLGDMLSSSASKDLVTETLVFLLAAGVFGVFGTLGVFGFFTADFLALGFVLGVFAALLAVEGLDFVEAVGVFGIFGFLLAVLGAFLALLVVFLPTVLGVEVTG